MAGYIGGGGIGNIALTYGYQTFNFPLMFATVFILIAFVWIIQSLGNRLSQKRRKYKMNDNLERGRSHRLGCLDDAAADFQKRCLKKSC